MRKPGLIIALLALSAAIGCGGGSNNPSSTAPILFIYVVGQDSQSIFGFSQSSSNTITPITVTANTTLRPSAALVHPSKNFFYVANFGSNNVTKYSRDPTTGFLTPLGSVPPTPVGTGPIAMGSDAKGQFLFVLNQGSGSISVLSVDSTRGLLTEIGGSPFATQMNPVSLAVSQSSGFLYVANGTLHTVSAFSIASNGALTELAGSPFDIGAGGNAAWVAVDPKGRFVYVADSANSNIVGFSIQSGGTLAPLSGSPFSAGGTQPSGIAIDANGSFLYVANQGSNSVSGFTINSGSGALTAMSGSPFASGGTQTSFVLVDASNKFLFSANTGAQNVGVSSIDANSGVPTQLSSPAFPLATRPSWLTTTK
jgi:6-phosphogluconolactonase